MKLLPQYFACFWRQVCLYLAVSHTIEEVQYSLILFLLPMEEVTGDNFCPKFCCLSDRNSAGKVTIPLFNASTLPFVFLISFYSRNKLEYPLRSADFLQIFLLSMLFSFFFFSPSQNSPGFSCVTLIFARFCWFCSPYLSQFSPYEMQRWVWFLLVLLAYANVFHYSHKGTFVCGLLFFFFLRGREF